MIRFNVLVGALALAFQSAPALAQSALEWAAGGMGRPAVQRARPGQLNSAFMQRVASAEGHLVLASWYGGGERLNRRTASGEVFRPGGLTAAHRTLPFGTRLAVSYAGRSVIVRINDRGPAAWTGRSLDLSRAAADALGFRMRGEAFVKIAVVRG